MFSIEEFRAFLATVVTQYEKSAPTVSKWADDLYIRLNEDTDSVRVTELIYAQSLQEDGCWLFPNYAANSIYKLMNTLGQDTTGHAGF